MARAEHTGIRIMSLDADHKSAYIVVGLKIRLAACVGRTTDDKWLVVDANRNLLIADDIYDSLLSAEFALSLKKHPPKGWDDLLG